MLFQVVQTMYWLALATWFGGVLFIAIAAPIIFRTVREHGPVLPSVLSVNLEGQHGTLLAGTIVGNILSRLALVGLICAGVLLGALIAHPFIIDMTDANGTAAILRSIMFLAAAGLTLADRFFIWPRIMTHRQEYLDHADDPEVANPALERLDRDQRRVEKMLQAVLFLLLGMILFSGSIMPAARTVTPTPHATTPVS